MLGAEHVPYLLGDPSTRHRPQGQLRERGVRLLGVRGRRVKGAAAPEQPVQPRPEHLEHVAHVCVAESGVGLEAQACVSCVSAPEVEHSVQEQGVEVRVQVQRRAEALDDRDRARLALLHATATRGSLVEAPNASHEQRQHLRRQRGVVREARPQRERERQHPLTHRHPVNQVRGAIVHPSRPARWAHPAALARKRQRIT